MATKRTYINRLKKWEHAIRTFRPTKKRKFDMRELRVETECGTTACALGWLPELFPQHFSKRHPYREGGTIQYEITGNEDEFFGCYVGEIIFSTDLTTNHRKVADRIRALRIKTFGGS